MTNERERATEAAASSDAARAVAAGGIAPAVPVPFDEDLELDLDGLRAVLDRLMAKGVERFTILGSSGEAAYLLQEEREAVVRAAAEHVGGRATLIGGVSLTGTRQATEEAKRIVGAGAEALLVGLPQYFETPLAGVLHHYEAVVEAARVPVLYYHYPAVLGLALKPREIGELFARVPLVGLKHSNLSVPELRAHLRSIQRPVSLFTGLSLNLLDALRFGGVGAICPLTALMPVSALETVRAFRTGDHAAARAAQARLFDGVPIFTGHGLPPGLAKLALKVVLKTGLMPPSSPGLGHGAVKHALRELGVIRCARTRPPQRVLSDRDRELVSALARRIAEL